MVKVTVKVEGMMCGHCEAHVNKAIQAAFGAEDVVSSHENGTTVFTVPEKVDEAKVEEVIKEAGYEFKRNHSGNNKKTYICQRIKAFKQSEKKQFCIKTELFLFSV